MQWRKAAPGAHYALFGQKALVAAVALAAAGQSQAFQVDTGNEDVQVRWDNTLRYNLAQRVQEQSATITGSANNNDGDLNFKKNSLAGNRLDLLSEVDFVYKGDHGFRVSAAAWADNAYNHLSNHSAATSNHLDSNGNPSLGLSPVTKRYNRGPSGEWLDAFVFTKLDLNDSPLYLKAGQHTIYWGESLFLGGVVHGIAYGQSPLDVGKGLSIPGAEAKELFRPLNNISANFQATTDLSLAAQYFLDWKPFRFPEAGSYLGFSDAIMDGGESLITPLGQLPRLGDIKPKKTGDYGLSARWSPEWLDGTLGFYYRNLTDKIPQTVIDIQGLLPGPLGNGGVPGYRLSYGDKIDLFGVSLSKNIGGVSVGAELSYRKNMPLSSDPVFVGTPTAVAMAQAGVLSPALQGAGMPAPQANALQAVYASAQTALPSAGDTGAARGNTMHAVLNLIGQVASTSWFDSFDWKTELTWNTWTSVTQHAELFKGRSGYTGVDRVSKDAWGFAMLLEPKWYQVWPSVDVIVPIAYSTGLSGTSAVAMGGSKDAGAYSVGVGFDVRSQYRFDIKYVGFFGKLDVVAPGNVVANDPQGYLKDRGMVVFNFKTTF